MQQRRYHQGVSDPQPELPRDLYTDRPPFRSHALAASHGHVLHVDEWGSADGIPALVLHGGPGSSCTPLLRRVFDPGRYRVVCIDQRGCGQSHLRGAIAHNTTMLLLDDLATLRAHLGIAQWLVAGGSWGAALAQAYALAEPGAVSGLLLRSTFMARRPDIDAFFAGAEASFPSAPLPPAFLGWLAQAMNGDDDALRHRTAMTWWRLERSLMSAPRPAEPAVPRGDLSSPAKPDLLRSHAPVGRPDLEGDALAACIDRYRVQSHYLAHGCWLNEPTLLQRSSDLPVVPTLLLHAPDDRICPPEGVRELRARLPHAALRWIPDAGHDPGHPGMIDATVRALDAFAGRGSFDAMPHESPQDRP